MSDTGHLYFLKPDGAFEVDFCERQLNLLAHAQAIELEIGSRCGGHGICGGDRVKVELDASEREKFLSPITEDEREHLSEAELSEGWRLACQCFPNAEHLQLTLRVPHSGSPQGKTFGPSIGS
jgi:ferredoxin